MHDLELQHLSESWRVQVMRVSPYAVHMSYVFGGVAAKRNRLREEQIWLDDRDYYDQKRLLTLDIHVPAIPDNFERLKNDYMVELHLKLMQHQLDQVRCMSSANTIPLYNQCLRKNNDFRVLMKHSLGDWRPSLPGVL